MKRAVLLIAHGSPAKDMPRSLLVEWRKLHAKPDKSDAEQERDRDLESKIRNWPRTGDNDPYRTGTEKLAQELRARLADDIVVLAAYNEFASPSIDAAVEQLVASGATSIGVLSTMMTPGGGHSERDIPEALARMRERYADVTMTYLWPYDLGLVAELLERQIAAFES